MHKNFGHIIFKICKDLANKNKKEYLRIECLTTNNRLNNIYEKHGFKFIRTGEDYYKYSLRECKLWNEWYISLEFFTNYILKNIGEGEDRYLNSFRYLSF